MKKILLFILIITLVCLGFITYNTLKNRSLTKVKIDRSCNHNSDNQFEIAIIGDSWVEANFIDDGINNELSYIKNIKISSFGEGGAKSKKIYENLFLPEGEKYSSKQVLNGNFDMVIIIAGVNDLASHIGKDFYSYHIIKIAEQLNECKILPIIVTIPEIGIEEWQTERPLIKKALKDFPNRFIIDNNVVNPRSSYNKEIRNKLEASGLNFKIIDFNYFINDYSKSKEMYSNHLHLSKIGYIKLGEFIGKEIKNKNYIIN